MKITKKQITEFLKSEKFRIILLIVVAALVRIYKLAKEKFWLDEVNYIPTIFQPNLIEFFKTIRQWNHPPFFFVIYHFISFT